MPKTGKRKRGSTGRRRSYHKRYRPIRNFRKRKSLALKQHNFVERTETVHALEVNTEAAATGHFYFASLSKMKQQTEYAALFEFYRIDKVVATFRYKGGNAGVSSVANNWLQPVNETNPLLYFKVDHNDNTADTLSTMKDSMKTKTHMFTNDKPEFSIQLKPAIQSEMYKSAVTTAYTPKWGQWIPTVDPTVPHYGLKCYAIGYKDAQWNPGTIEVTYKYYVSFKNNE